jgi:hypothetical protein
MPPSKMISRRSLTVIIVPLRYKVEDMFMATGNARLGELFGIKSKF